MLFYKLCLERSSIHQFKRFYLLGASVLAFAIPNITFVAYVEPIVYNLNLLSTSTTFDQTQTLAPEHTVDFIPSMLWALYALGVLIFLFKFCKNLFQIYARIHQNPKETSKGFIHVLIDNLIIPHTFFNYIFLNKSKFKSQQIPKEVLLHEQTHAQQKHSIDIICMEVLQIALWFNPLIYLLKKDIKLNHEFLADDAVLKQGVNASAYQTILLAFSSKASHQHLANAINYSSIKKRFTVMKTQSSPKSNWLRRLLILPLLAVLLYSFTQREQVVKPSDASPLEIMDQPEAVSIELMKEYNKFIASYEQTKTIPVDKYNRAVAIYKLMSKAQKTSVKTYPGMALTNLLEVLPKTPSEIQFNAWKDETMFALWLDGTPIKNSYLNQITAIDIAYAQGNMVDVNERSAQFAPPYQTRLYTKHGFEQAFANAENRKEAEFKKVLSEIANENEQQQRVAQDGVTKAQLAEYNQLAKHYNDQAQDKRTIKIKDMKRLKVLYDKMSKAQKATAQPLPNFPPPPPPPLPETPTEAQKKTYTNGVVNHKSKENSYTYTHKNDKGEYVEVTVITDDEMMPPPPPPPPAKINTGFLKVNGQVLYYVEQQNGKTYYNRSGNLVDKNGKKLNGNIQVNASDVMPGQYITKVYQDSKVVVEFKDNVPEQFTAIVEIPTPPEPMSPLQLIKTMAKSNAEFYYERKKISSEKAIELVKQHNDLNIEVKSIDSKSPVVNITKAPIILETD